MKNVNQWRPSRYIVSNGTLYPSRNTRELAVSSRLYVGLNAQAYNEHFHQHCRGRLLDLGCGKVPFYEFYRDYVDGIVCVDWNGTLHGAKHVDVFCDLTKRLPFNNQEFDTVLLSDVLEHIPTPQCLIREIARILRVDGKLILNVPFAYNLHESPHDYFRYTEFALRRMVEAAGLEVAILQSYGSTITVVADGLAKSVCRSPLVGGALAACIQSCASIVLMLTRRINRASTYSSRFPSMYFLVARKRYLPTGTST